MAIVSKKVLVAGINHPLLDNLVDLFYGVLEWHECHFLICVDTGMPGRSIPSPTPGYVENLDIYQYTRRIVQEVRHGEWEEVHIFGLYHQILREAIRSLLLILNRRPKMVYHPMGGDFSCATLVYPFDEIVLNRRDHDCLVNLDIGFTAYLNPYGSRATRTVPLNFKRRQNHYTVEKRVIMIGNSADKCYKHAEILSSIGKHLIDNPSEIEIIIPLSYHSCKDYIRQIVDSSEQLASINNQIKLHVLTDVVPPTIYYNQYLSRVTDAILLDGLSTGWSQISFVFCNGGNIYLSDRSPHLQLLSSYYRGNSHNIRGYDSVGHAITDLFRGYSRINPAPELRDSIYKEVHSRVAYLEFWSSRV